MWPPWYSTLIVEWCGRHGTVHLLDIGLHASLDCCGYVVGLPNNPYTPITNTAWVRARLCKLQKGCTRLPTTSDKVYQLLAHGRWFSPGTPASSATKTGRHDIAETLLKVALKYQKSKINQQSSQYVCLAHHNYHLKLNCSLHNNWQLF